jgi:hypothetical protein
MSRCRCSRRGCCDGYGYGGRYGSQCGSGCCNFPTFIILILILLQFSNKGISNIVNSCQSCQCNAGPCTPTAVTTSGLDKGIIFIIALFYLSCCNPCRSRY